MEHYTLPYGMPRAAGPGVIPEKGNYRPGFGDPPLEKKEKGLPQAEGYVFQPQVLISGGMLSEPEHTVISAGEVTDSHAKNVVMTSDLANLNGFVVTDQSQYRITDSEITFTGDGINDFEGWGAAVLAMDESTVLLENSRLTTSGVIRPCTAAGGSATLIVKNCELTGNGGTVNADTAPAVGGGMLVPPPALGIGGNCRTHLSTGNSHAYFYDTKITADGWAALSTDAGYGDLYIEANRCEIVTRNAGYGTFSDGGCTLVLNDCSIRTATHAMILAGRCKERLQNTRLESGKYGAMIFTIFGHGSEIAELSVQGGTYRTQDDGVLVKSANAYLDFRGVDISVSGGVFLHSVKNEDPMATKVSPDDLLYGIKAVLSDMTLCGDILHEDAERTMAVALKHTTLRGGIQNAALQLDAASHWIATGNSRVILYGDIPTGAIDAPEGVTIEALSDTLEIGALALPSGGTLVIRDRVAPLPLPKKVGFFA